MMSDLTVISLVLVNVKTSDHCLYKKGRLCRNLALCFVVVNVDLTVTDLGGARFARVKEEAWQSFGRGVA